MPALKLFGRLWLVATDDMVIPAFVELIYRFVWIIYIGYFTYSYYNYTLICITGREFMRVYLIGMLVLLMLNIILLVAIVNRSAQGSICDIQARRVVPPLLACKFLLLLPEAGWNVLGTLWAFTPVIECPADQFITMSIKVLVCLDWGLFVLLVIAVVLFMDPISSVKLKALHHQYGSHENKRVKKAWVRRFKCFSCWLYRDADSIEAFGHVGEVVSTIFLGSNLVPSDVIAGGILLRVKHKKESREKWRMEQMAEQRLKYKTDVKEVFEGQPEWISFDKAVHYMRLSMATYGCLFVLYLHCCMGFCKLLKHIRCCARCRRKRVKGKGDNCCMCHMAGFKYLSGIIEEDCIYVNFKNRIFEVPFCIISDHERKSIILAVRGSITIKDVFTDLVAVAEKVDFEGLPEGSMTHKGMLITAQKLKKHLDETKMLEEALSLHPNYDLIFTGHSLGAATAVLLGLMYRPTYPNLKVYAFSCPCILTKPAAVYCSSFVFTVGVGDDFVMRASINNIEKLRTQLFEVLQNSRIPKYQVFVNGLGYVLYGIPSRHLNTMWKYDWPIPQQLPARNTIPYLFLEVDSRKTNVSLYPAGNILHLVHREKPKESGWFFCKCLFCCLCCGCFLCWLCCRLCCYICCRCLFCHKKKKRPEDMSYEMSWVSQDLFDEMIIMPRMMLDHFPENVYKALDTIRKEHETD